MKKELKSSTTRQLDLPITETADIKALQARIDAAMARKVEAEAQEAEARAFLADMQALLADMQALLAYDEMTDQIDIEQYIADAKANETPVWLKRALERYRSPFTTLHIERDQTGIDADLDAMVAAQADDSRIDGSDVDEAARDAVEGATSKNKSFRQWLYENIGIDSKYLDEAVAKVEASYNLFDKERLTYKTVLRPALIQGWNRVPEIDDKEKQETDKNIKLYARSALDFMKDHKDDVKTDDDEDIFEGSDDLGDDIEFLASMRSVAFDPIPEVVYQASASNRRLFNHYSDGKGWTVLDAGQWPTQPDTKTDTTDQTAD